MTKRELMHSQSPDKIFPNKPMGRFMKYIYYLKFYLEM